MINPIKNYLTGFRYSLPVQLFLLHFKKYQVLLLIWFILFSTVNGTFMHRFGAHILFLYPEYLGKTNALSAMLVGVGVGIFVICWNITTFILHSRQFKFLAATTQPFLKYCINNFILPTLFLAFYLEEAVRFARLQELLPYSTIFALAIGFLAGFAFVIAASFLYFFGADKTIYQRMSPRDKVSLARKHHPSHKKPSAKEQRIRVDWYFSATFRLRQPRRVSHYSDDFLENIFGQHHLAAIFSILFVFAALIIAGYLQDSVYLQLPAAGSITVFFAVLVAGIGGFSHFMRAWSIPFALLIFLGVNVLYQQNILDPRNTAYGLTYNKGNVADYNETALLHAASSTAIAADSLAYIGMLEKWKAKQKEAHPVFVMAAVSGGGTRASTFTVNVMRLLDSTTEGGFMHHNFAVAGASGGMLGAAWYRELYWKKTKGELSNIYTADFTDAIANDLLNPVFSSFITRDLMSPPQYFSYAGKRFKKDRGYAFEQSLNRNTHGWMNKPMSAYANAETNAVIPQLFLSAVITRDGRRVFFNNHSARFLTRPFLSDSNAHVAYPDAIDFKSFFRNQDAAKLNFLSALRMNATFPYILPNVWLPAEPVIDVMDAGFRDNTGLETATRFMAFFREWLSANCSKVVLIQIRDKREGGWDSPYESTNIFDLITKPALLTQNNLFRFQEYAQLQQWNLLEQLYGSLLQRIVFEYSPQRKEDAASLSFHLTKREKKDIEQSLANSANRHAFTYTCQLLK